MRWAKFKSGCISRCFARHVFQASTPCLSNLRYFERAIAFSLPLSVIYLFHYNRGLGHLTKKVLFKGSIRRMLISMQLTMEESRTPGKHFEAIVHPASLSVQ